MSDLLGRVLWLGDALLGRGGSRVPNQGLEPALHVALAKRGFRTVEVREDPGIAEASRHVRQGLNGKDVQAQWHRHYARLGEEHTFYRYGMRLALRVRGRRHPSCLALPG